MGRKAKIKKRRQRPSDPVLNRVRDEFDRLIDQEQLVKLRAQVLTPGTLRSSCILSTKLLVTLAHGLGIKAKPLTVRALVFNPVLHAYAEEHGTLAVPPDVLVDLTDKGARFLVVGSREAAPDDGEMNRWPGHLVAILSCPGRQTHLVDLAIDQAHRPHKGIHITQPIALPVHSTRFLKGKQTSSYWPQVNPDGSTFGLCYDAFPKDRSYERSPDWRRELEVKPTPKGIEIVYREATR